MKSEDELIMMIEKALKASLQDLFDAKSDEKFYYITLTTSDIGLPPVLSAWSWEALEEELSGLEGEAYEEDKAMLKWSYADSPYYDFNGAYDRHFSAVRDCFNSRSNQCDEADIEEEILFLLSVMEKAMSNIIADGFFSPYLDLKDCLINVEYMPPIPCNADRAKRLNPPGDALNTWLREAGEAYEGED